MHRFALCVALLLGAAQAHAESVIRSLTHNNPEHRGASARVFDDKVQLKWRKEQTLDWYVYHEPGYITDPKKMCSDRPNAVVVNRRQNEHTISGLQKGKIYTFMVVAHYLNKTPPPQNSHCDYVYHAFAVTSRPNSAGTIRNINPGNQNTKFHLGLDAVKIHWNKPRGDVTGYKLIYAEKSWKAWQMCTFDFPSVQLDANARSHTVANLKRKQHYTFMVTAQFRNRTQDCAHLFFAAGNTHPVAVKTTENKNRNQANVATKIFDDKATIAWRKDKVHKWHIYVMPGFVGDAKRICTERPNAIIIDGKRNEHTIGGLKRNQQYTVLVEPEYGGARLPPQIGSHCDYVYHRSFVAGEPKSDFRIINRNLGNKNTTVQPGDGAVRFTWRKPTDGGRLTGYRILYAEGDQNPTAMCANRETPVFRIGTSEATEHTLLDLKTQQKYTFMLVAEFDHRERDCEYLFFGSHATKKVKVKTSLHKNPDHRDTWVTLTDEGFKLEWRLDTNVQRWYVYHKPGYVADAKEMCTERPNAQYVASNVTRHTISGVKKDQLYTILIEGEHQNADLQAPLRAHCDYAYHGFAIDGKVRSVGGIRNINPSGKGSVIEVGDRAARLRWNKPRGNVSAYQVIHGEGIWKPWEMCVYKYQFHRTPLDANAHQFTVDDLKDGRDYTFLVRAVDNDRRQECDYILFGSGKTQKKKVTSALHKNPDHSGARMEVDAQGDFARVIWPYQIKDVRRWHIYYADGYVMDPKRLCTDRSNAVITSRDDGGDHYIIDLKKGQRYTVLVEAEYSTPPQLRAHCDYVFHQHFTAGEPDSPLRLRDLNPGGGGVTVQTGDRAARLLWKRPRNDATGYRFRVRAGRHNALSMCTEKVDLEKQINNASQNLEHILRDPLLVNGKTYTVMIVAELGKHARDCNYLYTGTFAPNRAVARGSTHKNPEHAGNSVHLRDNTVQLRWRNDRNVRHWHIYHTEGVTTDVNRLCTERPNPATIPGGEFAHTVTNLRVGAYYTFLVEMEYGGNYPPAEMRTHCNYIYLVHAVAGNPKSPFRIRDFRHAKGYQNPNMKVLLGDGMIRHQFQKPGRNVIGYRHVILSGAQSREEMCRVIADTQWKVAEYKIEDKSVAAEKRTYYTRDTRRQNGTLNTAMFSAVIPGQENDCNYFHYSEVTPYKARVRSTKHLNPSHRNSHAKPGKGNVALRWDNPRGDVDWKWHIYYKLGKHTDAKKLCTERPNAIVVGGYVDKRTIARLKSGQVYTFLVESEKGNQDDRRKLPPLPPQYNTHCNYVLHMYATPK